MKLYGFWRSLAAFRVRIALNLKGLNFEEPSVDLLKGEQLSAQFRQVNPQGMLPALDTGEGYALYQSVAIIEYLDEIRPAPPLLPAKPRDRARVRGLALIAACDAHPLIVPRVRNYLADALQLDEPTRLRWIRHWLDEASAAIEQHLVSEPGTGRYAHGDHVSLADICLVSHVVGSRLFQCDLSPFPTLVRLADESLKLEAFASAHPLAQPGAPQSPH